MDRCQKVFGFNDDLVLIPGAMARPLTEGQIVWMRGAGQDLAKTAFGFGSVCRVKPQSVLVFAIKPDCATSTIDVIGVAILRPVATRLMNRLPLMPEANRRVRYA